LIENISEQLVSTYFNRILILIKEAVPLLELNRELNKEIERRGTTEEQLVKDMEKTKQEEEVFEKQCGKAIRRKTSYGVS